jgi:hypothetical protein
VAREGKAAEDKPPSLFEADCREHGSSGATLASPRIMVRVSLGHR